LDGITQEYNPADQPLRVLTPYRPQLTGAGPPILSHDPRTSRHPAARRRMAASEPLRNPYEEHKRFAMRAIVAAFGTFALLALLAGRMAHLQIINHDHFKTLSQENRVKLVAMPPPRGLIYDRNGVVLAENLPSYRLEITPSQVTDLQGTLARLEKFYPSARRTSAAFMATCSARSLFLASLCSSI
jgi:hypothetical protein